MCVRDFEERVRKRGSRLRCGQTLALHPDEDEDVQMVVLFSSDLTWELPYAVNWPVAAVRERLADWVHSNSIPHAVGWRTSLRLELPLPVRQYSHSIPHFPYLN